MSGSPLIVLVGVGNMGGAMLSGWLAAGYDAKSILVIDPSPPENKRDLVMALGVRHERTPPAGMVADILVLAVKPQVFDAALAGVSDLAGPKTVVLSVAAGKPLAAIAAGLRRKGGPAVRAMPNTPALVQRGITVACANAEAGAADRARVDALLAAVGKVEWVDDEGLIDAVTAVSGSGPAYVFHLAECMAKAGVEAGLPEALAKKLARETVVGAGELMARSTEGPAQLRRNVTSPHGTTAAALGVLGQPGGLKDLMSRAIAAAKKRAGELAG